MATGMVNDHRDAMIVDERREAISGFLAKVTWPQRPYNLGSVEAVDLFQLAGHRVAKEHHGSCDSAYDLWIGSGGLYQSH